MAVQIQIRPLGRGVGQVWSIYGEYRGAVLPKDAKKQVSEFRRERDYDVRIVGQDDELFIKEYNGTSIK